MIPRRSQHKWSIGLIHARRRRASWWGEIQSSAELLGIVQKFGEEQLGVSVTPFTSESEPELVDYVYNSVDKFDAFLVNPAMLTTYGESFRGALAESGKPYIEVHFANLERWFQEIAPNRDLRSIFTYQSAGTATGMRHYSFLGALVSLVFALDDENFLHPTARGIRPVSPG